MSLMLSRLPQPTFFGDNALYTSSAASSANRAYAKRYTLPVAGNITSIKVGFTSSSTAGTNVRAYIMSDAPGAPYSILIAGSSSPIPAGGGFVSCSASGFLPAGDYWIVAVTDNSTAQHAYNPVGTGLNVPVADGNFPFNSNVGDFWPGADIFFNYDMSMYALYTAVQVPALGSHSFVGIPDSDSTNPAITPDVTTTNGSSFAYFLGGYTSNNNNPVDSKGNALTLQGSSYYVPFGTDYQNKCYYKLNGVGGSNHHVTFTKNVVISGEVSMCFIEILNSLTLIDSSVVYREQGTGYVSGNVTTTGPALLVAAWWGDSGSQFHTVTPSSGFTVVESYLSLASSLGVQCAFATKQVGAAGTYNVTWSPTPDQGCALYLLAFQ